MATIDLSVIIANYNTRIFLEKLLTSLEKSDVDQYQLEIIVVDNGSSDGSVEMVKKKYQKIKSIINDKNLGFAAANNQGIDKALGRYILLLNSDTEVEKDTLKQMIAFMDEHSQYGAATCRIELTNGKLDPACHRGFPTPWAALTYFLKLESLFPKSKLFGQYHQGWKKLNEIHELEVISGAFFMIRREVINKVGLLDEGFFMYGEDIDWCFRIQQAGFQIAFVPSTKIVHVKGASGKGKDKSKKVNQKDIYKLTNKSFWQTMKLFYKKHYTDKYPRILKWLIFKIIDWKTKWS